MGVVLHPQGGYQGSEADVSLTALVLIALNEGKQWCNQKIPVGPKDEGRVSRMPYPLHTGSSPALVSFLVLSSLLAPRPLSSDHLPLASSLDSLEFGCQHEASR